MSEVVQQIGALAGLAGVLGLVLLAALHVAQARDVRRLREWAGGAPERAASRLTVVPEPAAPPRPPAPRPVRQPVAAPERAAPGDRRLGTRSVALVGVIALAGMAAFGVAQLTGDDDPPRAARAKGGDGAARKPRRDRASAAPGTVTVAVLNGTSVVGLAARLREEVAAAGFAKGIINDFSEHQVAASVVQYAPGREAEAEAVGRRFGIRRRAPVTDDVRALAGDAAVVVIAGADQAP